MANEKRLIDADALLSKAIEEKRFVFQMRDLLRNEIIVQTVYRDLGEFILNAPTVDAVEVVHGRTIQAEEPKHVWMDRECEKCHCLMLITDNYCPTSAQRWMVKCEGSDCRTGSTYGSDHHLQRCRRSGGTAGMGIIRG